MFNLGLPEAEFIEDPVHAQDVCDHLMTLTHVGLDTETTGLDIIRDRIVFWSLSDGESRWCIRRELLPIFEPLFLHKGITKILTNAKYDKHMLANAGFDLYGDLWDTIVMDWLLHVAPPHGLKECVTRKYRILGRDAMPSFGQTFLINPETGKKRNMRKGEGFEDILLDHIDGTPEQRDKAVDYASKDAWASFVLAWELKDRLEHLPFDKEYSAWDHYVDVEIPFTHVLWRMERRGITVDVGYLDEIAPAIVHEIARLERSFAKEAGRVVNLNSPKQLRELFYDYNEKDDEWTDPFGNPCKHWTKGGKSGNRLPSTDKNVLKQWADLGSELAVRLQRHRSISKTYSTYIVNMIEMVDSELRIHTSLNQAGTATGRLSSDKPNLQNVPVGEKDEFHLRAAFVAGEGKRFLVYDYCLAEGTEISTPHGPVPIERVRVGDLVYSYNRESNRPRVRPVDRVKATGMKKSLVVVLDNGSRTRCSPEHRWLTLTGDEVQAKDLVPGQRLLPLRKSTAGPMKYTTLYSHSAVQYSYEHVEVAEAVLGVRPEGHHVHHKDEHPNNNDPDNLEYRTQVRHLSEHATRSATKQWKDPAIRQSMVKGICRSIKERGGYHGERNPNYGNRKGPNQVCPQYGATFYAPPCHKAKFCSRKCYFDSKNHRVVEVIDDGLLVPTHDIRVKDDHNYALAAGVFVHNSQLEMKILAHLSGDEGMIEAINSGMDIHCDTTARIYGIPFEEVVEAKAAVDNHTANDRQTWVVGRRKLAKNSGFLIVYGGGPRRLMITAGVGLNEAKEAIKSFREARPGIAEYTDYMKAKAHRDKFVRTLAGRYRHLPYIDSHEDHGASEREAVNTPIQGCRDHNSRVLTVLGHLPMRELQEAGHPALITYTGEAPDYEVHDTGDKQTFEVETTHGTEVVTEDHHFFIYADQDLQLARVRDLKPGDYVVAEAAMVAGGPPPDNASVELAELIGILCGDGSYTRDRDFRVCYGNDDEWHLEIRHLIRSCLPDASPVKRKSKGSLGDSWYIDVSDKPSRRLLQDFGLLTVSRDKRVIPAWLYTAPIEFRVACLRGLFDSDGTLAGGRHPQFTNISKDLCTGFLSLANSLGLFGRIVRYDDHETPYWRVTIVPYQTQMFLDIVQPRVHNKQIALGETRVPLPPTLMHDIADTVLASTAWAEKSAVVRHSSYQDVKLGRVVQRSIRHATKTNFARHEQAHVYQMRKGYGGRDAALKFLSRLEGTTEVHNLMDLVHHDWAEIRAVRPVGIRHTMDIELLGDDHTYVGHGLLQHNSAADICKAAMLWMGAIESPKFGEVAAELEAYDCHMLLQIHDEIIFEIPDSDEVQAIVEPIIKGLMEHPFNEELAVPLTVGGGAGYTWSNAK